MHNPNELATQSFAPEAHSLCLVPATFRQFISSFVAALTSYIYDQLQPLLATSISPGPSTLSILNPYNKIDLASMFFIDSRTRLKLDELMLLDICDCILIF